MCMHVSPAITQHRLFAIKYSCDSSDETLTTDQSFLTALVSRLIFLTHTPLKAHIMCKL